MLILLQVASHDVAKQHDCSALLRTKSGSTGAQCVTEWRDNKYMSRNKWTYLCDNGWVNSAIQTTNAQSAKRKEPETGSGRRQEGAAVDAPDIGEREGEVDQPPREDGPTSKKRRSK